MAERGFTSAGVRSRLCLVRDGRQTTLRRGVRTQFPYAEQALRSRPRSGMHIHVPSPGKHPSDSHDLIVQRLGPRGIGVHWWLRQSGPRAGPRLDAAGRRFA
jgi:hypothetical protein